VPVGPRQAEREERVPRRADAEALVSGKDTGVSVEARPRPGVEALPARPLRRAGIEVERDDGVDDRGED
jgi:hypothetical protein